MFVIYKGRAERLSKDESKRTTFEGRGIPVPGDDIDTDRIIPARYLKCVTFEDLGNYAFYDERFNEDGGEKSHPFNEEKYRGGKILFVNKNFGCGSSREHAPQSLMRMGIKALIGESFAEIFAGNCTALGIPVIILAAEEIEYLITTVERDPQITIAVDLEKKTVHAGGKSFSLEMQESYRQSLTLGSWDTVSTLLQNREQIKTVADRLPYIAGY